MNRGINLEAHGVWPARSQAAVYSHVSRILLAFQSLPLLAAAQVASKAPGREDPASGLGCVRTINTAEQTYALTYKSGYSKTLAAMGMSEGWKSPSPEAAGLIDETLTGGKKAGYVFIYKPGAANEKGEIKSYTLTARPMKWHEGALSFFTDESGVIRWTAVNRAPTAKDATIDSMPGLNN